MSRTACRAVPRGRSLSGRSGCALRDQGGGCYRTSRSGRDEARYRPGVSSPVETDVENGVVCVPSTPFASALVLSGSSGRSDVERARLLARHGVAALALRYFGGIGQPSGLCEIPLETFYTAVDTLAQIHPRVVLIGVSKGAEAALSVAATDSRVSLVVAIAPRL